MIFAKVVERSKKKKKNKKKTKRRRRRGRPIFTMVKKAMIDINKEVKKERERTAKHKDSHKRGNGKCKMTEDE